MNDVSLQCLFSQYTEILVRINGEMGKNMKKRRKQNRRKKGNFFFFVRHSNRLDGMRKRD